MSPGTALPYRSPFDKAVLPVNSPNGLFIMRRLLYYERFFNVNLKPHSQY